MHALHRPDLHTRSQRRQFVQLFTARVATDPLLGPLFAPPGGALAARPAPAAYEWWDRALTGHCYLGRPPHNREAPGLSQPQLTRWRQLLATTLHELFQGPQAAELLARLLNGAAALAHRQLMCLPQPLRSRPPGPALAA